VTEDQAKTKWCPKSMMVLVTNDENRHVISATSFNRMAKEGGIESYYPKGTNCITSDCMWWLWDTAPSNAATENAYADVGAVASGHCGAIK